MIINTSTGNPIVDAVGEMNFTGNIIPEAWFKTVVNDKGKPQLNAIILLGEIVYWYRPLEVREEKTNNVYFKKKFADEYFVQISYAQINDKFGLSEKQSREALKVLESLGVAKRVLRDIKTSIGILSNVMYIELSPEDLKRLTYPDDMKNSKGNGGGSQKVNTCLPEENNVISGKEIPNSEKDNTNTEITTEITTETTTTPVDVVCEFERMGIDKQDGLAIIKVADGDYDRVRRAVSLAKKSHNPIENIVGFMIKAISNGYTAVPYNNSSFRCSNERTYDYDELLSSVLG